MRFTHRNVSAKCRLNSLEQSCVSGRIVTSLLRVDPRDSEYGLRFVVPTKTFVFAAIDLLDQPVLHSLRSLSVFRFHLRGHFFSSSHDTGRVENEECFCYFVQNTLQARQFFRSPCRLIRLGECANTESPSAFIDQSAHAGLSH